MLRKILCFLAASALLCFSAPASDGGAMAVVSTVPDTQGMQVGAKACIVMEAQTGRVLFAQNEHERLPMASTTKIMTALLTLEQPDLDAAFEVDSKAIMVEGSSMGLREGDKVSLRALAAGMLLLSGNDAANAAAERVGGSIPEFVDMMNKKAREIGMSNTSFETPSGLDGDRHYSTAYDMALLTRAALANAQFVEICSQYKMRVTFGNPAASRWMTNHNKLLNYYEGTFGVKTGFTKKSGRCLVSSARKNDVELICVTLNCPDDWATHQNLYDRYFPELQKINLCDTMPDVTVKVTGGKQSQVSAVPFEEACVPVPVQGVDVRYEFSLRPFLYAPVTRGEYMGEMRIFIDDDKVFTLSLIAESDVGLLHEAKEEKPWWKYLSDLISDN